MNCSRASDQCDFAICGNLLVSHEYTVIWLPGYVCKNKLIGLLISCPIYQPKYNYCNSILSKCDVYSYVGLPMHRMDWSSDLRTSCFRVEKSYVLWVFPVYTCAISKLFTFCVYFLLLVFVINSVTHWQINLLIYIFKIFLKYWRAR